MSWTRNGWWCAGVLSAALVLAACGEKAIRGRRPRAPDAQRGHTDARPDTRARPGAGQHPGPDTRADADPGADPGPT